MATHTLNSDVMAIGVGSAPGFQNAWGNAPGQQPAGFWKDPHGHVHVRGSITGGAAGSVAFTLPAGFRPAAQEVFSVTANTGVIAFAAISAAGTVLFNAAAAAGQYVALGAITFLAEA